MDDGGEFAKTIVHRFDASIKQVGNEEDRYLLTRANSDIVRVLVELLQRLGGDLLANKAFIRDSCGVACF